MLLLGVFAGLALALATVGIYGVMAYVVAQGRRELGIRLALGSTPGSVVRLVLLHGLAITLVGLAAGLASALLLTRLLANLLFGVAATDPVTFVAVAGLLGLVALAACYVPARRAGLIDPMRVLRDE
jgi:ABC-type antimicrobial peptide transport system permease subunit